MARGLNWGFKMVLLAGSVVVGGLRVQWPPRGWTLNVDVMNCGRILTKMTKRLPFRRVCGL